MDAKIAAQLAEVIESTKGTGEWIRFPSGPTPGLVLWAYDGMGYVNGLFYVHDTLGVPLWQSLQQCAEYGWRPCLQQFRFDAASKGWSEDKTELVIREALTAVSKEVAETWPGVQ